MSNPYPALPRDKTSEPMRDYPSPKLALARYASENSSASSVISVTHDTTALEVAAVGGPAVLRWISLTDTAAATPFASVISAAGTANFDHVIPTGTVRRFAIPKETMGIGSSSIVGANREFGLYQRVAIKSIGVASVLATEY